MGRPREYDRSAIAAFYRTHTQAETAVAFRCSTKAVKRAVTEHGAFKMPAESRGRTPKNAIHCIAKERGEAVAKVQWRLLRALAKEPEIIRNLLDWEEGG